MIKNWKKQIFQINVLNNKINNIKYANISKLHESSNKFDVLAICSINKERLKKRRSYKFDGKSLIIVKGFPIGT